MQLIAEAYDLLKYVGGLSNAELSGQGLRQQERLDGIRLLSAIDAARVKQVVAIVVQHRRRL